MNHKILFIASSSGLGLTFYFTRLILMIKEMGDDVVVLSDHKQHYSNQYSNLSKELVQADIKRYTSNVVDRLDPSSMIKGIRDIRTVLRMDGGFEIIHAGGVRQIWKTYLATKGLSKKPKTFATIRSLPSSRIAMSIAAISYNFCVNKSIALCNYTKNTMQQWGVDSSKLVTMPLFAPDLAWFDDARKRNVSLEKYGLDRLDKPIIFYAASHLWYKGFLYYLRAARKVLGRLDATFVVGGRGPLTEKLKDLTRMLGIQKHVVFTGWISNYDMPYILSNIPDICVSTSLIEQLPSYVLECMAAGKPVVATSVGGVPEAVADGLNGYLLRPRESDALSNKIIRLIEEPEEAKKMGKEGRKIVKQQFNMEIAAANLREVYEIVTHER